jgi:EmrB/QacA subfamily drug resistance transporter
MTATSSAQTRRSGSGRSGGAPTGAGGTAKPKRVPKPHDEMTHREVLESLSGLMLVLFVALISSTIVSIALPGIIGALHGSQNQYTWVVTAALLTATVATPIWGRLADLFDKKLMIQISIVIFVLGSVVAGFAQNTPELLLARGIQGIGVGGLQALVQVVIGAMIPPRERGRYNGYLGAVMAVATVGGPLLGGLIVDTSWLGWRWCFFIGVPIAVAAFLLLQKTLHLVHIARTNVKIDYLGAFLISGGVSILLIWFTFAGKSFDWVSWQTAAYVGTSVLVLAAAVFVEIRAAQPVVPMNVVRMRVPALAIVASLAVGMAMFGGAVFFGLYFQIGRHYSPTESGLMTIPMMAGVLVASTIGGRLVSKTGKIKPYVVTGAASLVAGFVVLAFMDHATPLWFIWLGMVLVGAGVGLTMQNLILAVQNTVALNNLGAASGAVTFFRSLGGTAGVAVLGAVLASKLPGVLADNLAKAGIQFPPGAMSGSAGSSLDINAIPEPIQTIVRASYGDAIGHIFLISAAIGVVGLIAALLLPRVVLRTSIDLPENDPVGIDGLPETEEVVASIGATTGSRVGASHPGGSPARTAGSAGLRTNGVPARGRRPSTRRAK